jgi:protein tyrosine/serine phosphatase
MNTKLLKKIRKRFAWYKSTTNTLILIDHEKKRSSTVDAERLKCEYPNFPDENINEESLFRFLKVLITKPFIEDYLGKVNYNFAMRRFKKRIK